MAKRTDGLLKRYELFASAATLAAHASDPVEGFRQRTVRFFIELFANWIDHVLPSGTIGICNTQVQRYLDDLVLGGYAKKSTRASVGSSTKRQRPQAPQPCYKLTRVGLLELLTRMVAPDKQQLPEQFYFRIFFLHSHGHRLKELIRAQGTLFPTGLRLEIEALLDCKELLRSELIRTEKELKKISYRVDDSLRAALLAERLFAGNYTLAEVAEQLEKKHPYELNSQKSLQELVSEIPPDLSKWELSMGAKNRAELIWAPSQAMVEAYYRSLKQLQRKIGGE